MNKKIVKFLLVSLCSFLCSLSTKADESSAKNEDRVTQSTENTSIELFSDGQDEIIAKFSIKEGWHIYWSNPGEIGKPTQVQSLSQQSPIKILNQSVPVVEKTYDILNEYIYKNTAYFYLSVPQKEAVGIEFSFVECSQICKPEKITFDLQNLPQTPDSEWKQIQIESLASFPQTLVTKVEKGQSKIKLKLPYNEDITVIPAQKDVVSQEKIEIEAKEKDTQISWQNISEQNKLQHALVITPGQSYDVQLDYDYFNWKYFLRIIILAFLGGIILNAMPCVFPILSLKVFELIKKGNGKPKYKDAFLYCSGVVCAFLALACLLAFLKDRGEAIGWGFQLQSPYFVGTMLAVFFVLFLLMIEAIKFPNFAGAKIYQLSAVNSFMTGFFAVLIASPCTGPFMGAAIGYAFMHSKAEMFAVFLALSLGYALPFSLVEISPRMLQKILPKPGRWMLVVKQILALPILLTCIWLAGILVNQVYAPLNLSNQELDWQKYDAQKVQLLAQNNENIFIDFTAEWCLTCMFNEKTILHSKKFKDFVKNNHVYLFRADLTENNESYNQALRDFGRDGIPLYIYYRGGNYRILPIFFSVEKL